MGKVNYWEKFEEGIHYHIYNRGINGVDIYKEERNYYFFLKKWIALIHPFFETISYCLMPNHFHFLVRVRPLTSEVKSIVAKMETVKSRQLLQGEITQNDFLEDQFKRLFSSYALAFNKQEQRTGSLFQKRFKRISLNNEFKIWHLIAYIHHNPIHHSFTKKFGSWKFCSYATYLSEKPSLINREEVLKWFDDDLEKAKEVFLKFHINFKEDRSIDYLE